MLLRVGEGVDWSNGRLPPLLVVVRILAGLLDKAFFFLSLVHLPKVRMHELAKFDESRRVVGMLNPTHGLASDTPDVCRSGAKSDRRQSVVVAICHSAACPCLCCLFANPPFSVPVYCLVLSRVSCVVLYYVFVAFCCAVELPCLAFCCVM